MERPEFDRDLHRALTEAQVNSYLITLLTGRSPTPLVITRIDMVPGLDKTRGFLEYHNPREGHEAGTYTPTLADITGFIDVSGRCVTRPASKNDATFGDLMVALAGIGKFSRLQLDDSQRSQIERSLSVINDLTDQSSEDAAG